MKQNTNLKSRQVTSEIQDTREKNDNSHLGRGAVHQHPQQSGAARQGPTSPPGITAGRAERESARMLSQVHGQREAWNILK